jgi:hypothetical protein
MGEIIHKLFFKGDAIFHIDKFRYARLLDEEFEEFCKLIDEDKLKFDGINSDKRLLRQDIINLFHDFRKAKEDYKKEKVVLNGESK